jgi:nitrilase
MSKITIAALQIGSDYRGKAATLANILAFEDRIAASGAQLVVMPEALLGGYPKGETFGTRLGYRMPEGREALRVTSTMRSISTAPKWRSWPALSDRTGAAIVVGVIERAGSSLLLHRPVPRTRTGARRQTSQADADRHRAADLGAGRRIDDAGGRQQAAGKLGAAICWENHMPLFRAAMYAKGVEIWCAPTVDERDIWRSSMRHIAHEGRCFVISACQVQGSPAERWASRRTNGRATAR